MNLDANSLAKCINIFPSSYCAGICTGEQWILSQANAALGAFFETSPENILGQSLLSLLRTQGNSSVAALLQTSAPHLTTTFSIGEKLHALSWAPLPSAESDSPQRFFVSHEIPLNAGYEACDLLWRQLRVILDSIHDGIWMIDGEGTTVYVNKAVSRITGIEASDVLGKHVTAPMQEGKYNTCVTLRALKEKKPVTMFDDYASGKRCLNTSIPIFDDSGKIWRVLASIRDMPELEDLQFKLAEAEHDALRGKGKLKAPGENTQMDIIGNSLLMQKCISELDKAAKAPSTVLILGETGTGKTLAASYMHRKSQRAEKPFITINCAAIPASLIEAELFGYEKGAFTGASQEGKKGLLELADKGSIFLDEIGDLPLSMQVKLLHVLDNFSFRRVGGVKNIQVDVRIMAATNRPLEDLVKEGAFRADLYYRLRVLSSTLPPLRERTEDIATMALHFLDDACKKHGIIKFFDPQVLQCLTSHSWPGNVRELRATVEFMAAMTEGKIIKVRDLPSHIIGTAVEDPDPVQHEKSTHPQKLKTAVQNLEYMMIRDALIQAGSTYKAAALLGVSQSTIVRKAQQLRISIPE